MIEDFSHSIAIQNLLLLIRVVECFQPLPVIKGVVSVQKIESGQWLPRKQRITVLMQ
jgi:hypothetical protein